jgi:hypothetical protein
MVSVLFTVLGKGPGITVTAVFGGEFLGVFEQEPKNSKHDSKKNNSVYDFICLIGI